MTTITAGQQRDKASGADLRAHRVSIIIPARNEEKMMPLCLEAVCRLARRGFSFEVIVVDNGSSDQTVTIAQSFSDRLAISVISRPHLSISGVRNAGAAAANGDILAFLDADCIVREGWLENAVRAVHEHPCSVLGSDYLIPEPSRWVARCWYEYDLPEVASVRFVPGGDLIVTRSTFDQLGGFNPSIQTNEDCEFCMRARLAGIGVYGIRDLAVVHLGTPQTLWRFLQKQRWHGTHVFRVFRTNLATLQNIKPIALAAFMLLAIIALLFGCALAATGGSTVPLFASACCLFGGPLILAGQRAAQRNSARQIAPLYLLFFAFALGRACSLLNPKNW